MGACIRVSTLEKRRPSSWSRCEMFSNSCSSSCVPFSFETTTISSGHYLNSYLFASQNQGSVYKNCRVFYKCKTKVYISYFRSDLGPVPLMSQIWLVTLCLCGSDSNIQGETMGLLRSLWQLKKPFMGPIPRPGSCQKEPKRTIFVIDLRSRQIYYFSYQ